MWGPSYKIFNIVYLSFKNYIMSKEQLKKIKGQIKKELEFTLKSENLFDISHTSDLNMLCNYLCYYISILLLFLTIKYKL